MSSPRIWSRQLNEHMDNFFLKLTRLQKKDGSRRPALHQVMTLVSKPIKVSKLLIPSRDRTLNLTRTWDHTTCN